MDRQLVLKWVGQQYGTVEDYPWNDNNAVLRHKSNNKWYGVILEVNKSKLGFQEDTIVDVLNVKCDPVLIGFLRESNGFHIAYHMNKEKWISIRLDGSVPEDKIKELLDMSYELTKTVSHKTRNKSKDNK